MQLRRLVMQQVCSRPMHLCACGWMDGVDGVGLTALLRPTHTGELALKSLRDKMLVDATGRALLQEKPVITSAELQARVADLSTLPPDSFGFAYHTFMASRG